MTGDCDDGHREPHPYRPGNVGEDGDYIVGYGRPPSATRFAAGDGRRRGRRPKGVRNFDTDFAEEAARLVPVREKDKVRKVSKQRASIIRLLDNAYAKGQNAAIHQVMEHGRRIAEKTAAGAPAVHQSDREILEAYLRDRAAELALGPLLGDPPDCEEEAGGGL
jgi:hypothetical protein